MAGLEIEKLKKYTLSLDNDKNKWNNFVINSNNGTPFSLTYYIDPLNVDYNVYYILNGKEIRAGILILTDGNSIIEHELVIYNGLIFNKQTNKQNNAQVISENFYLNTFIIIELTKVYNNIFLSLDTTNSDMRPYLWYNYHNELPKFHVDVRYTSFLDITSIESDLNSNIVFNELSSSRKREVRLGIKKKEKVVNMFDIEQFLFLYEKTMSNQLIDIIEQELNIMKNLLINLHKENMIDMFFALDANDNVGSVAVYLKLNDIAYYLFGANDPLYRKIHLGTTVLWNSFRI